MNHLFSKINQYLLLHLKGIRRVRSFLRRSFPVALIVILLLGPVAYLLSRNPKSAGAAWFDDSWGYRQKVEITNAGSAQTDFQVAITLATNSLITASKMQSDCDDIRITNINGKLLPHWIEDGTADCNTSTTKIWVKADSISTSGVTLYVYYGNPSASNMEKPKQVFEYFEDFESYNSTAGITNAGWVDMSINGGAMAYNSNNGTNNSKAMLLNPDGGSGWKRAAARYGSRTFSSGAVLDYFYKATNDNYYDGPSGFSDRTTTLVGATDGAAGTNMVAFDGAASTPDDTFRTKASGTQTSTAANVTRTGSHVVSIHWGSTSRFYFDGSLIASSTTNIPSASLYIFLHQFPQSSDAGVGYFDDLRVRKYAATEPTIGSPANEEKSPGPVAYWSFDEGYGTNAQDKTVNNNDGTISGATWQTEDQCVSGKCLYFDGSNDVVTVSNTVSGIQTVSFWVKPITTTEQFIDLNGSAYIQVSSGTISTTFTSPAIYVNGKVSSALVANQWQYVSVTTGTAISGSAIKIGQISTNYGQAFFDEVKIYPYARTADQIKADYAARGASKGISAKIGDESAWLTKGLVGYWKMDEASWTVDCATTSVTDSSGAGNNGKSCPTTTGPAGGAAGKFGNAGSFDGSNDYVTTSSGPGLTGQATFSFWVKADRTAHQTITYPLSVGNSGSIRAAVYIGYGTTIGLYDGVNASNTVTNSWVDANDANVWRHITVVYDKNATRRTRIFKDGVELSMSTDAISGDFSSQNQVNIGRRVDNYWYLDGSIDEVRIYNRALTPAEVSQLYNWAPGPVGYWNMDEASWTNNCSTDSVFDSSGNGNHGDACPNSTGPTGGAVGKYGKGGSFDGSNDYVDAGTGSSLQVGAGDFSMGGWAKFDSAPDAFLISKGSGGAGYPTIGLRFAATTGRLSGFLYDGTYDIYLAETTNRVGTGWHHFFMTVDKDSSTGWKLWVDGQNVATGNPTLSPGSWASSLPVLIGSMHLSGVPGYYRFNGSIDEVRVYNYARSPAQIKADMLGRTSQGGAALGVMMAGPRDEYTPVAHWRFDEGYGDTANDQTKTNNGDLGGSGQTCPASGTVPCPSWSNSGKFGKALSFDGTDDYVQLNESGLPTSFPMTATMWVKTSDWDRSGVLMHYYVSDSARFTLALHTDGTGSFLVDSSDNSTYYGIYTNANANEWHHFVAVFNSSGVVTEVYQDGILKSNSINNAWIFNGTDTLIGKRGNGINFLGLIDEPKVYNFALTADQVKIDYNAGSAIRSGYSAGDDPETGLEASLAGNPPVAEWKMDEKTGQYAYDTSGNGNTGTLGSSGGADSTDPTWISGKIGQALSFDGTDDYVNFGDILTLSNGTIEAWVKFNAIGANDYYITKNVGGNNAGDLLIGFYNLAKIYFELNDGVTGYGIYADSNASTGVWYHTVFVFGSGGMKMYLNGILQADTDTYTGGIGGNGANFLLGRYTAAEAVNCVIDHVRVYNYARSQAQIAYDYNRGGPVGWWKFDECQGGTAYDASGKGNNGTITIGVTGSQDGIGTCTDGDTTNARYNGVTGKRNSSLNFDGTDDYVSVTDNAVLDITNAITIEAWIYRKSDSGAAEGVVTKWSDTSNTKQSYLFFVESNDKVRLYLRASDGSLSPATDSTTSIALNTWYHAVATYDGSNARMYINGVLETTSTAWAKTINATAQNVEIGRYEKATAGTYFLFNGLIDEPKIYNYALSAVQIKQAYNEGSVRFGPATGSP